MNKKKRIEDLSLETLEAIKDELLKYKDIDSFKESINNIIINKVESNDINERFNTEMFRKLYIFTPYELEILELNGIHNIKELIEADLNNCMGMTKEIKEKFEWARKMYSYNPSSKKNR